MREIFYNEGYPSWSRIDATMLGAIERYIKQAIVDRNAMVSSSALVAGKHLLPLPLPVIRI